MRSRQFVLTVKDQMSKSTLPIAHLFYGDSDLVNGHGHRYIEKETNRAMIDPLCHWPGDSTRHYHCFYFQRSGVEGEKVSWFVDGRWSEADVNNGFARYRDDLRQGWHIVEEHIRYIPSPLLIGDHAVAFFGTEESATTLALDHNARWPRDNVGPKCINSHFPDWGVIDLFGFLPELEFHLRRVRMINQENIALAMGYLDNELIKAYTLDQRHEVKVGDIKIRERSSQVWSKRLREMVKASDEKRKEAERMQVVCQGDWIDD